MDQRLRRDRTGLRTVVLNTHERVLAAPVEAVGHLLDSLAGPDDRLWPSGRWPAMRFDRPLGVGARGGHGPIRYHVESNTAGRAIRFRFDAPRGFDGYHEYALTATSPGSTVIRHTLVMRTSGIARGTWPLLFRPLHDALIEDSLDQASQALGLPVEHPRRWSRRVLALRVLARSGRAVGAARRRRLKR